MPAPVNSLALLHKVCLACLDAIMIYFNLNLFAFFSFSPGKHSFLVATFHFKRRIGYFLIETYFPSVIVVIISWVSFWIPTESAPARVTLGVTTILTMVTLSRAARESLPKVNPTPRLYGCLFT